MSLRTYVDAGVLIAVMRGKTDIATRAMQVCGTPLFEKVDKGVGQRVL